MSATMEKLKASHLTARKAKDQVAMALLGTLISEAAMVGKTKDNRESTEDEVLDTTRKFLKNAEQTKEALVARQGADDSLATVEAEIAILKTYLPQQMSEEDLNAAVTAILADQPGANMGMLMKALQTAHKGLYDGKLASAVIKQRLGA